MKRHHRLLVTLACLAALYLAAHAGAPIKTEDAAPRGDLEALADSSLKSLESALADKETFDAGKEQAIPRAAGLLAVAAQALAEHKEREESKLSATALRDAALAVADSDSLEQAREALAKAQAAASGQSTAGKVEHDWSALIAMDAMMHEVDARNTKLRRILRRIRRPETEALDPSAMAILGLSMSQMTDYVEEQDAPQWRAWSLEFSRHMTHAAAAVKQKDTDALTKHFMLANEACDACHEKFRDLE